VDQEPSAESLPGGLSLDELGFETMLVEGCGRGETGYAAADDQDRPDLCHVSLHRNEPIDIAVGKRLAALAMPILDPAEQ
jgi:hypothetical protein